MTSSQIELAVFHPSTQRRNARRREEFLRKKLNFSSSASDSPADISPSATTVETTPVAAADATSTLAPEVAPLPSPSVQKAKSDQVQEEFPLESVLKFLLPEDLTHMSPLDQNHGPRNGLRRHWGRRTREA